MINNRMLDVVLPALVNVTTTEAAYRGNVADTSLTPPVVDGDPTSFAGLAAVAIEVDRLEETVTGANGNVALRTDLTTLNTTVTGQGTRLTTAETDIDNLEGLVGMRGDTAASAPTTGTDTTTLWARVKQAEADINDIDVPTSSLPIPVIAANMNFLTTGATATPAGSLFRVGGTAVTGVQVDGTALTTQPAVNSVYMWDGAALRLVSTLGAPLA